MTNIEQVEQYMKKQKLIGKDKFIFNINENSDGISLAQNRKYKWTKQDKDIVIPSFVTTIAYEAFEENSIIETVTFQNPDNIRQIMNWAFNQCTSLKEIQLPEKLDEIYSGTFAVCTSLEHIKIPNNIEEIGDNAFLDCANLRKVEIDITNSKLEKINRSTFEKCDNLENLADIIETIKKNKILSESKYNEHREIGKTINRLRG